MIDTKGKKSLMSPAVHGQFGLTSTIRRRDVRRKKASEIRINAR